MVAVVDPVPDVTAYPLDEALKLLSSTDYRLEITRTAPPGKSCGIGAERVVRQRFQGDRISLLVTFERFK